MVSLPDLTADYWLVTMDIPLGKAVVMTPFFPHIHLYLSELLPVLAYEKWAALSHAWFPLIKVHKSGISNRWEVPTRLSLRPVMNLSSHRQIYSLIMEAWLSLIRSLGKWTTTEKKLTWADLSLERLTGDIFTAFFFLFHQARYNPDVSLTKEATHKIQNL